MPYVRLLSLVLATVILWMDAPAAAAQCGMADAIGWPVDSVIPVTIASGYDDFSLTRSRFGNNHTAVDVAFNEQGAPVYAAARGVVTYSDIFAWGTERGVVVIGHDFPDGNRYYTVYGHMEETDTFLFPAVGACVEMGDVIGAIGWPQNSKPHLHYEVRNFMPDDGGPGYVDENPLEVGWYHPLDFTRLWQARFSEAFVAYATLRTPTTVAPGQLSDGSVVFANGSAVWAATSDGGMLLWRVQMGALVTGLVVLPNDRVVARSREGETVVLLRGRYEALWRAAGPDIPPVVLNDVVFLVTDDGSVAAYTLTGTLLWQTPPVEGMTGRVRYFETNRRTIGLIVETSDGVLWREIAPADGAVNHEMPLTGDPLAAPIVYEGWVILSDSEITRFSSQPHTAGIPDLPLGRAAQLAADLWGNTYVYAGDDEGTLRSWDAEGVLRWQTTFPTDGLPGVSQLFPPLLAVDGDCVLYALDSNGWLYVFDARTGDFVTESGLYAGGSRNRQPAARFLRIAQNGDVHLGAGYLSLVTLDGHALAGGIFESCLVG